VPFPAEVRPYDDFPDDVEDLCADCQAELDELLTRLEWPYDPSLQRACILHEDEIFEYRLAHGSRVFWEVRKKWGRMIVILTGIENPA
jgi:hypothetical protein